jgi:predicted DNA-binding protein with PD1-like motif
VGQVDPTKTALFNYAEPRQAGRTYLLSGCATLGKNEAGEPTVHCHAALRTEHGDVKGGHIVTQASIVGPGSAAVLVTAFDGFGLRVMFDAETNISLFQPHHELS